MLFGELASDEHWFVHQHCSGRLPAMTTPYSFAIEKRFEVQMTIIKGDGGGIFFRTDAQIAKFYSFFVDADGVYALTLYTDSSDVQILRNTTLSDAIKQGLNQTNLIAVSAIGNTITLYINHQQLVSVNDSTYSHGQIGLFATSYRNSDNPTEVAFSDAKVWALP